MPPTPLVADFDLKAVLDAAGTMIITTDLNGVLRIFIPAAELLHGWSAGEVVGRQFRLIAGSVRLIGGVLSTVMERVHHFSKHYLRTTDGTDRVSATHIECEAKQLLRMEAEHTLVNGSKLIKARGSQIHFG